ncbi:MAG: cell wall hydrolase [Clostridium fessum]
MCSPPASRWKPTADPPKAIWRSGLIVNRVKSGKWGKSISSVIYADGQFPGTQTPDKYPIEGVLYCRKAAKAALAGANQIGDYLYFTSTKSANYDSYSSYQVVGGNCFL